MALTARILQENGRNNIECYSAGVNGASAGTLPIGLLLAASEGGRVLGLEWAIPCSTNGVTVEDFAYTMATPGSSTKPREDAVKVIVVEDIKFGGSYKKAVVPDAYELSTFLVATCAGCSPVPDVTLVDPQIYNGGCTLAAPTLPGCVYTGSFYVAPLTGSNTTFTATANGYAADGTEIVFSPTTEAGTTVALLATAMQTGWASEMGSGTFTPSGNTIVWTATICATLAINIVQS